MMSSVRRAAAWSLMTAVVLLSGTTGAAVAQQGSALNTLMGSWSGPGRIELTDGRSERILCNAYYSGAAGQLNMAIRCKSDTQSIEMRSRLADTGGRLTGNWEERTYNAEGAVSGTATDAKISLAISGAISGSMVVDVAKTRHTVTIRTAGTALKAVTVTLNRS